MTRQERRKRRRQRRRRMQAGTLALPEAGTWSVKATLNGQTSDTKSVSVVDSYAVALTFFSATITVNVDSGASVTLKKGGTTIATKTSNGTAVFTVTETVSYTHLPLL